MKRYDYHLLDAVNEDKFRVALECYFGVDPGTSYYVTPKHATIRTDGEVNAYVAACQLAWWLGAPIVTDLPDMEWAEGYWLLIEPFGDRWVIPEDFGRLDEPEFVFDRDRSKWRKLGDPK